MIMNIKKLIVILLNGRTTFVDKTFVVIVILNNFSTDYKYLIKTLVFLECKKYFNILALDHAQALNHKSKYLDQNLNQISMYRC